MTVTEPQRVGEPEDFLDLLLADDELVRAEFDALIAACWETPCKPPRDKFCPAVGGWAARPPPEVPREPGIRLGLAPTRPLRGRGRGPPRPAGS
jgi:hypothetical protein